MKKVTQPQLIEKSFVNHKGKGFKSDVSQKNLLHLKREHPYSLPILAKPHISYTETLKVLGIRVEFQEEIPDDPKTTGNGLFDMRTQEKFLQDEGHAIDPSPHDTLYFKKHILALHNYWWTVSKGKLAIEGEIYPKSETLAYRLPHSMSYYGAPDSSLSGKVEMLRQFFHDSFNLADSLSRYGDPSIYRIDFQNKKYDSFVIFHAGADQQGDLGALVAPTPGDLFTGFIVLGDTVYVEGDVITEGLFMPETESQDNRVTALNAVFAHEFGHQLGLVDLYNSQTFMTQVGDFSLMDNNFADVGVDVGYGGYVSGVLPAYPDAWSKAFLGFIQPEEIKDQEDIRLFASEMLRDDLQTIKVPINSEEYFLIENRQVDLDGDHTSGLRADSVTNVILGPVDSEKNYNREYDWLLPGSGILIWHVDEGVAYLDYDGDGVNNFWGNDLQLDKDRRFLTIVEADGIIDFGGDYYTGYGRKEDLFYKGNNTALTPYTFPSSKSQNKSNTHIWITNIGHSDTVMSLDISQDWQQAGFPQKIFPETNISSLVYADVDNNGNTEIFASSDRFIYAWGPGGTKLIPNNNLFGIIELNGDTTYLPLAIFAESDSAFFGPPSLGDLNGDDTLEVVAATVDGRVYAWHPYDLNKDGRADLLNGFPLQLGGHLRAKILVAPIIANFDSGVSDREILVSAEPTGDPSRIIVISYKGKIIYSSSTPNEVNVIGLATTDSNKINFVLKQPDLNYVILFIWHALVPGSWGDAGVCSDTKPFLVVGDINRDGKSEAVVCCRQQGTIHVYDHGLHCLEGFPLSTNEPLSSAPVLGDIDRDGYLEIIVASTDKIFAYNFNGTPVRNFPITVSHPGGPTDLINSSPILGDVDGDGYPDIIVGTKDKQILAYNKDGNMVDGFPLPVGGAVTSSPILLNLDKDVNAELLVASDDGFICAWDLPGEYKEESYPWTQFGYDCGHTNHFPKESLPPMPPLAGELLPTNLAYNYPNPAKDQTKIRYYLKENAKVNIKIYDLSGMLVDEFSAPGEGQTDNECPWNSSKFASGVYLCRVEAKSSSENNVIFFKIAVVK
ncbi:MAG: FG-GAP-like repeat-containing protein [candidate division Zixibacteria bacterium]|nr:FG-GAP-like repeat-containing protein [candidate division Zixibacteria bacterium]